jgi:exosortase
MMPGSPFVLHTKVVAKGQPILSNLVNSPARRWLIYLIWAAVCCLAFWNSLLALVHYALGNDNASHILVVPLIVAWLIYTDRAKISFPSFIDLPPAMLFSCFAAIIWGISMWKGSPWPDTGISPKILSFILFLIAGFLAVFGRASAKATWFSFAFLGFAVPLPEPLLNPFIYLLQYGSAAVAEWIFDWSGVPVLREGFVFRFSGFSIEVAQECSGIRSSLALLILAVLVAHFAFSKLWKKIAFVIAGLLMMMVKNGVRIATLTILAKYVDPDFLFGRLHHRGGVVFFLIGLALLAPVYWILRRGEGTHADTRGSTATA